MELEFDKEMDAILRKARSGETAVVTTAASPHLDADSIAAFAENALPDKAKLLYMEHFADCDKCRKQLSQTILMNLEADAAAASTVSAPIAEAAIPWYQNIFRTPNLALAMGALVLAFSGFLGYLVLQNGNETPNAEVSQVTEPQPAHGGPYYGGEGDTSNTAASNRTSTLAANSANTAAPASNTAANSAAGMPGTSTNTSTGKIGGADSAEEKPASLDDKSLSSGGALAEPAKPVAAAPPPVDQPATEREKKENEADEVTAGRKDVQTARKKLAEDRRVARDAPPPASNAGPSRSGPLLNQQSQVNNNVFEMAVTRLVSGKRFENRNGAWYDSAYHGQGTTNVNRGTDAYKKLDGGLRHIADTLGGTVVVVWKEKAYRIR